MLQLNVPSSAFLSPNHLFNPEPEHLCILSAKPFQCIFSPPKRKSEILNFFKISKPHETAYRKIIQPAHSITNRTPRRRVLCNTGREELSSLCLSQDQQSPQSHRLLSQSSNSTPYPLIPQSHHTVSKSSFKFQRHNPQKVHTHLWGRLVFQILRETREFGPFG